MQSPTSRVSAAANSTTNTGSTTPHHEPPGSKNHTQRPDLQRSLSAALRFMRSREEHDTYIDGDEAADREGDLLLHGPEQIFCPNPHIDLPVYTSIHRIRRLILASIDDPYTSEQLKEPRLNVLIVRPLVERLYDPDDVSVVYCLLVNRMRFLREQSYQSHHQTVNVTRANLCEIVASKILRRFDEDYSGREGLLLLANVLVSGFDPFQQAPPDVIQENERAMEWAMRKRGGYEGTLTALELAIVSRAKYLLSGVGCQKVVDAVHNGRVVYTPTAFIDLIPDHYKHKPVSLYDPRKSQPLNQYRLIVPRTRNMIEFFQFLLLFIFYCIAMGARDHTRWTWSELMFAIYAAGWCLDEFASMIEHGWDVHTQNLWSFLDITFFLIYIVYIPMRLHGWRTGNLDLSSQALDVLSIGAPILMPRLAFSLMPESMVFISLRAMLADFFVLTLVAVWCFAGFLLALRWLAAGRNLTLPDDMVGDIPDTVTISKWMLWIWFGLDGTGIQEAPAFHNILGPALMVLYAFLGNTLFLTVLVSILSNTFSQIASNSAAEIQFRRAVITFAGVKSDAIFAYRVPFNIIALFVLIPLRFVTSERWFHKANVTLIRVLNFPILLAIHYYERRYLWRARVLPALDSGPTKNRRSGSVISATGWTGWRAWLRAQNFNVHSDVQAVFDYDPPKEVLEHIEEVDELPPGVLQSSFSVGIPGGTDAGGSISRSRSPRGWRRRWSGSSGDIFDGFPGDGLSPRGNSQQLGEAAHSAAGTHWKQKLSRVVETP